MHPYPVLHLPRQAPTTPTCASRRRRLVRLAAWTATVLLWAVPLPVRAVVPPGNAAPITVHLVNALTEGTLANVQVTAKRRVGDSFSSVSQQLTDANGQATFLLPGLGTGVTYVFTAKPFNGGTAMSGDVTEPGDFVFAVGTLPVQVVAGDGAPLGGTAVTLKEKHVDGSLRSVAQGTTDASGLIVFDPYGLGTGRVYLLEARSPWDNSVKRSNEITTVGAMTFVVGNAPLIVTLVDALSLEPLAGKRITASERLADGSLKWTRAQDTDGTGRTVFDLTGLGSGRIYVLKVQAFNGGSSETEDLTAAGDYTFKVGTLTVTLVAGGTENPLPGVPVTALEKKADGTLKSVKQGTTDEVGVIRFDLPGLGQGRTYLLRAASPWDGTTKTSNPLTQTGAVTVPIGNAPLRVTLLNHISRQALAGIKITANERLADGTNRWVAQRTTDDSGLAVFDLDGLGDGRLYYLTAKAYTNTATTPDLNNAGDYELTIGTLEVTAIRAGDGTVLVNHEVSCREKRADGTFATIGRGYTDVNGVIRFDPAGLGTGRTYVLEAKSPVDGTTKRSDAITATGRYSFTVGNAPLNVAVLNYFSGDPLAGLRVSAYERLADGTMKSVRSRTTDATGAVSFDLAGLGSGRTYVLTAAPYGTGTVYSRDLQAPGRFEFRVGSVEVTAARASDGAPLPALKVVAREKQADGRLKTVATGTTDAAGIVRFDFRVLDGTKTYVLEATSPVDGSLKRSQDITAAGKYIFTVGNAPVVVSLRNAYSGTQLAGIRIDAYERVGTQQRWTRTVTTDGAGQAAFDLDGLDAGRIYFLRCTPYNGGHADSADVTRPGPLDFLVGTLEVAAISGATDAPLVDSDIAAYEIQANGRRKWIRAGTTDAAGIIRFDLPGLGGGKTYVLEGHSPVDGSHKYSEPLTQPGQITFVVGNKALNVMLIDGMTQAPIAAAGVGAVEVLPDGNTRWAAWGETDAAGMVHFDLDGLGSGRVYVLETDPYEAGGVWTEPLSETGDLVMRAGTIPFTLIDDDNDVPLAGITVTAYEKLPDGGLRWAKCADTDANGTIRFDLEGISRTTPNSPTGTGRVYVFKVCNPFDDDEKYYSGLVDQEGPFEFRVSRTGSYPLDLVPPTVSVTTPTDGANVDAAGFTMTGFAADNATVTAVTITVADSVKGTTTGTATYDAATQRWTYAVTAAMVTQGQSVMLTVRASDQARNQASAMLIVRAIADSAPPQIVVTSHQQGGEVEKTGFLLAGTASDDIGVTSLVVTVDDPELGRTVNRQRVDVTPGTGAWTFSVLNGQITQGQTIRVSLEASDATGQTATMTLDLVVVAVDFEGTHLINRITFGSTPQLYTEVATLGADAFVDQQLNPPAIDDSAFTAMLAAQPRPTTVAQLQAYALQHAIYSRRQLREVMTWFWDNHFNTDEDKHKVVAYELAENDAFRVNALGDFRALLDISAKSPAMLEYLDNAMSVSGNPNENYARELLELHTMGVDGGYTQRDVEEVARAFTGWTVQNGQFTFNAAVHDTGAKVVLGQTLAAGRGIEDGEEVLDILTGHASTARFVCTKLAQVLISDTPPPALVDRCAQAFLDGNGQIALVVRTILRSPEFGDPRYFRAKAKTPIEFVVAIVRNFSATPNTTELRNAMDDMGMVLFLNPIPTGYSETGDDWINSNTLLQRIAFANQVARATAGGNATTMRLQPFFRTAGFTTADGIVGFLFQMLFHHDYTALDRQVALDILTANGTEVFDIDAPTADARLRRMVGTVMSYPGYQFQ